MKVIKPGARSIKATVHVYWATCITNLWNKAVKEIAYILTMVTNELNVTYATPDS